MSNNEKTKYKLKNKFTSKNNTAMLKYSKNYQNFAFFKVLNNCAMFRQLQGYCHTHYKRKFISELQYPTTNQINY